MNAAKCTTEDESKVTESKNYGKYQPTVMFKIIQVIEQFSTLSKCSHPRYLEEHTPVECHKP